MGHKAIFLDRDGVINEERKDYVKNIDEFKLIKNSLNAIKFLKEKNFLVIIITNQSAINRGLLSIERLNEIHESLINKLGELNSSLDGIYFCPHKPEENCLCRKPKPGLILKAIEEFKIDPKSSWMIGDNDSDVIAANSSGCKGIKIGKGIELNQAVEIILSDSSN